MSVKYFFTHNPTGKTMQILIAILVPDDEGPDPGNFKRFGCRIKMHPTPKEVTYLRYLCNLIDINSGDPDNTISCSRINSEQTWEEGTKPIGWFKILRGLDKKWENNEHVFSPSYPDLKNRTFTLFPAVSKAEHLIIVRHETMNGMEEDVYSSIMKKVKGEVHEFMFQDIDRKLESIPYLT